MDATRSSIRRLPRVIFLPILPNGSLASTQAVPHGMTLDYSIFRCAKNVRTCASDSPKRTCNTVCFLGGEARVFVLALQGNRDGPGEHGDRAPGLPQTSVGAVVVLLEHLSGQPGKRAPGQRLRRMPVRAVRRFVPKHIESRHAFDGGPCLSMAAYRTAIHRRGQPGDPCGQCGAPPRTARHSLPGGGRKTVSRHVSLKLGRSTGRSNCHIIS